MSIDCDTLSSGDI